MEPKRSEAIYTIPEPQALRFVDGDNGFIIPVARKRRSLLTGLPTDGQAAYRLFYDAEARKLLEEAEGPAELKNLERIYSAYFITSVGDNAADRLGDLYFELGRFDRAADCWLAVLREHPDTDLSPGSLSVKAALALCSRGNCRAEFEQIKAEAADRYNDEKITLGGQTASPRELLTRLLSDEKWGNGPVQPGPASSSAESGPRLAATVEPAWQLRFAESVEAGMTPLELTQWESNSLSAVVPAATVEGSTLFVNFMGHVFAVDLPSGKMLWRSASYHNLELAGQQNSARGVDGNRFAIVAAGEYVWALARDMKDQNFFAPFQLICRRADKGEIVWKSADLPDYAAFDLVGFPLLADGKLFIPAKSQANPQQQQQGQPQQFILAIQPHDGKLLWKTEIGTFRQGQQFFYYHAGQHVVAQHRLVHRGGHLSGYERRRPRAGSTRNPGHLTGVTATRRPRSSPDIASSTIGTRNLRPSRCQAARVGGGFPRQGSAVRAALCRRAQPDESPLGAAGSRRRHACSASTTAAVYLGGDELCAPADLTDPETLVGDTLAQWQHGAARPCKPRRAVATDAARIFELDPRSGDVRRIFAAART